MKLLQQAILLEVEPPDEDIINKAIFIGLRNEIQVKALLMIIEMFPPTKIVVKILLKQYLKKYSPI